MFKLRLSTSDLDRTFYISLFIKAGFSLLEIIGGALFLIISPASINHVAASLTQSELSEDPNDFIAAHILKAGHDLSSSGRYFAAFYLLSHGLVKIFIIAAVFKQRLWAYPALIVVLSAFITYQLYRLSYKFSFGLIILTLFDIFIIWLTQKEYKKHKKRLSDPVGG
jgi:uncharacterized membrane protein